MTLPSFSFETQTPSSWASTQTEPPLPISIGVTAFVAGSIRKMRSVPCEPTQTERAPVRMQAGLPPVRIVFTTRREPGSIRLTVPV